MLPIDQPHMTTNACPNFVSSFPPSTISLIPVASFCHLVLVFYIVQVACMKSHPISALHPVIQPLSITQTAAERTIDVLLSRRASSSDDRRAGWLEVLSE